MEAPHVFLLLCQLVSVVSYGILSSSSDREDRGGSYEACCRKDNGKEAGWSGADSQVIFSWPPSMDTEDGFKLGDT